MDSRTQTLKRALSDLLDTIGTAQNGDIRTASIPSLEKFWSAYDAAREALEFSKADMTRFVTNLDNLMTFPTSITHKNKGPTAP